VVSDYTTRNGRHQWTRGR